MTELFSLSLACDLIYLGSVDVSSAGSDSLLTQTVQQLQSLDLSTFNIVTITVSREGITLQEANNGLVTYIQSYVLTQRVDYVCMHIL